MEVAADADQEMAPVDVAAGADPANNQDPEADGGLNDGLAPTDLVAPPMSVGRRQPNEPTEAERLAHNRTHIPFADWCESCVRGRGRDDPHRARQDHVERNPIPVVQCDYFFFKAEKEDILCKAISAIDSAYNRTMALECEFKGLSDQAVPKHLREYLKSLGFERAQVQGDQKELSTMFWTAQSMDCPGGHGDSHLSRTNQHTGVWNDSMPL